MSVRVDAAVRRHPWISFAPHLTLDGGLAYPPWPEQQAIRFKHDLPAPSRSTCHGNNVLTSERTHRPRSGRTHVVIGRRGEERGQETGGDQMTRPSAARVQRGAGTRVPAPLALPSPPGRRGNQPAERRVFMAISLTMVAKLSLRSCTCHQLQPLVEPQPSHT
ncbi:hypothetical protein GCM10009841_20620 [Microlunatus panaciterrae]